MHERLAALLPIDEFRVCCHDDADGCDCRKPKPGLLTRPPLYDLSRSVIVGDRWRDIEAGRRAGCRAAILIDYGYDEGLPTEPDVRVRSLAEAADWILSTMVNGMNLSTLRTKIFARWRRARRHAGALPPAAHQGLHHQSDADAQGRHHRLPRLRAAGARRHSRPADLVRSVLRRVRRDGAPGARDRHLGRARLREDPGDQHQTRVRPTT